MIACPNCGELGRNDITVYSERLRKQDFSMLPVLPVCRRCGEEAAITHRCHGGNVIVLNGTCGSGKSTVAETLLKRGFPVIDGDCVIQVVKHKKGTPEWNFDELAEEIGCEIDILSMFDDNFVVSSVILPEDLDTYTGIFQSRNLNYRLILLKPEYQTAVERCRTRTCHDSITPEYWIKYFYETLNFDGRFVIVDNTDMTPEETAARILEMD